MAILQIEGLSFRYPGDGRQALDDISINVQQGDFVVIFGTTGSGKSTLLRQIKKELRPHGERSGEIFFKGKRLEEQSFDLLSREIGLVMQDPENQIVADRVIAELVFAMENLAVPNDTMRRRAAEMVHAFGLESWIHKPTAELSGGQKQILNLASVLLLQPQLLLLDEPTSQLDPIAAKQFIQLVSRLNQEFGITVLLTEHRLDDALVLADRTVCMDRGKVIFEGTATEVIDTVWKEGRTDYREYVPSIPRLYLSLRPSLEGEHQQRIPLTVKEGRQWFDSDIAPRISPCYETENNVHSDKAALLGCRDVLYRYEGQNEPVLNRLSFDVFAGDFLAVVGANGSGKSTLLQHLAGLLVPQKGDVHLLGSNMRRIRPEDKYRRIGYLPQNPMTFFAYDTIKEELAEASRRAEGLEQRNDAKSAGDSEREIVELFQLSELLHKHPYDLSGGERQKAALACILLSRPEILLLDEPTKGMDPIAKVHFADLLRKLHNKGLTMVFVTHDIEFAAKTANRCAMLFDGQVVAEGTPRNFFSENVFYTTAVNRIVRSLLPQAITNEDVIQQCREVN